jgi:hypothetical protein
VIAAILREYIVKIEALKLKHSLNSLAFLYPEPGDAHSKLSSGGQGRWKILIIPWFKQGKKTPL